MPRIPGPSDIPDVAVQNTRRVIDVPVDPTGQALQEFGRAAEQVAGRVREARVKSALAEADLDATRELAAIEKSGLTDDDPDTFAQRAREAATKVFAERGAKLRDGMARRAWELRSKEALGTFELRAADVSRRRSIDLTKAQTITVREKTLERALDPTVDRAERDIAANDYRALVRSHMNSGLFGEAEGAQEIAQFDTRLRTERGQQAFARITSAIDEDAGMLATAPQRFDEIVGARLAEIQNDPDLQPELKTRLIGAARQGAAVSTVQALIEADPGRTLKLLQSEKAGGAFAALGDKRDELINAAQGEIQRREVKFKSEVQQAVSAHVEALKMGLPIERPLSIATVRAALGESVADTYELMVGTSVATQGLATRPLAEVAKVATQPDPPNATAAQQKAINAQRNAAKQVLAERSTDPATFAIRRGLVQDGGLSQMIVEAGTATDGTAFLALVDKLATAVGARAAQVSAAASSLGMPNKPLTSTEAQQLGAMLNGMGATGRAEVLRRLGAKVPDTTTFSMIMNQLRPDSPVTAYAGVLTQRTRPVGDTPGQAAAALLLEGEDILNSTKADKATDGKGKFAMPQDSMLRAQWSSYTGSAYRGAPEAEDVSYQAFRASYAALASKQGKFDGMVDPKLAKKAAEIATGGVVAWGGKKLLLPWGMDRSTFEDSVREGWGGITAQNPALRGYRPQDVPLRPLGGGRYAVEGVLREDGSEIVIRVGERAATPRPQPAPSAPPQTAKPRTGPDE